jgi:hypothetical protein
MSQSFIKQPDNGPHSALSGLGVLAGEQPAQDPMPVAMADYSQEQIDGLTHSEIADRLRLYSHPLLEAAADSIDYLAAQEGLLEKAQQAAERARAELAETKRPLDEQMARLNQRVIELTGELDALRLKLPTVTFGDNTPKPPCTVCGAPFEKHGSYPTCATHPYTPDATCQHVLGAACVGAECATGCVRARGVNSPEGKSNDA